MKALNVWLDDILKGSALIALMSQIKTGARWTGRHARCAWRYVCQTTLVRYTCGVGLGALMLAIIWLTARQFRRVGTAEARAELATFVTGVGLMFALFVVAQLGKASDSPPDLNTSLGRS